MRVLWRKAPLMLLRFPALLVAIVAVSAITALTSVAGPTFVESAEVGSLREGLRDATRWTAGSRLTQATYFFLELPAERRTERYFAFVDRMKAALSERVSQIEGISRPSVSLTGSELVASSPRGEVRARLVSRDTALSHVTRLQGKGSDGVWIADVTAEALGLGVGDRITLTSPEGRGEARVAGLYRYLPHDRPFAYWTPLGEDIYRAPGDFVDPPVFILATRGVYESLMDELQDFGSASFYLPLVSEELSLPQAEALSEDFSRISQALRTPGSGLWKAQGSFVRRWTVWDNSESALPGIIASARQKIETVTPIVDLLSLAARLVALAVVGATGFFMVKRRRTEIAVLAAWGVGPLRQALRLVAESFIPMTIGAVAGVLVGYWLVAVLGPAQHLPLTATAATVNEVGVSSLVGMILLVLTLAAATLQEERNISSPPTAHSGVRWLQVAAVLAVVGASVLYQEKDAVGATSVAALRNPRTTLIPLALILAGGIVVAAILRTFLPRAAASIRYRSPSLYLAAKRLAGASAMTQVLVVCGAGALGVAIYGATTSASVEVTAVAKAKLFIGSDYSAWVPNNSEVPETSFPATGVIEVDRALLSTGRDVSILAIDPDSFESAAYWQDSFADQPLRSLIASISRGEGDEVAVLATQDLGAGPALVSGEETLELRQVATVETFPGDVLDRPLVVMTRDALREALGTIGGSVGSRHEEIWARGETDAIEAELQSLEVPLALPIDVDKVLDTPALRSLLWILNLLVALGAAAAIIAVVGILLYLQARQRAAWVSSAMTRRMGLSRRREFLSWWGEVAGALFAALFAAITLGLVVADAMNSELDPRPNLLPPPVFVIPASTILALGVCMLAVSVFSAWRVQRSIDETNVAQVMRT